MISANESPHFNDIFARVQEVLDSTGTPLLNERGATPTVLQFGDGLDSVYDKVNNRMVVVSTSAAFGDASAEKPLNITIINGVAGFTIDEATDDARGTLSGDHHKLLSKASPAAVPGTLVRRGPMGEARFGETVVVGGLQAIVFEGNEEDVTIRHASLTSAEQGPARSITIMASDAVIAEGPQAKGGDVQVNIGGSGIGATGLYPGQGPDFSGGAFRIGEGSTSPSPGEPSNLPLVDIYRGGQGTMVRLRVSGGQDPQIVADDPATVRLRIFGFAPAITFNSAGIAFNGMPAIAPPAVGQVIGTGFGFIPVTILPPPPQDYNEAEFRVLIGTLARQIGVIQEALVNAGLVVPA